MKKEQKKLIHKLKNRYRLVIINDTTFEEKFSFSLTPMNVFVGFSSFLVFFTGIITLLIVFTPLREYIPGYADPDMKRNLSRLMYEADSLERVLKDRDSYYRNILNIIEGNDLPEDTVMMEPEAGKKHDVSRLDAGDAEKGFIKEYENGDDNYSLAGNSVQSLGIHHVNFFNPVKGLVSNGFSQPGDHFAVDVVTKPNESVKSVLDGRVILAEWTAETGNVIAVQHRNNIISVYKHNAALLKKTGTFVSAGEPIAIVGNSGELTSGPHLHFELWENCKAVNPELYINF